ncbi:DMT family transporter [Polaribacter sp. BAL334]|uniref:DMT family transporter n=1 Tax=Polaribacter sp. BAL334 TaxID=1708178 RepID=UPI0018D269BD|nr:DMT family transporter [Polaribacter sp. BAL334]MBG7611226.1 DMT family transporter [Polaribacter sp. BAL334]
MIFSVIAFALMNIVVKYLSNFNVYQIVFFRTLGTLAFTIPIVLKQKIPFLGNKKRLLIARGFLGLISLSCFFSSLQYLSVGTAVSLRYTAPIFAGVFAMFFLKEKIKAIQWVLFIIAFIGVLIIKGFGIDVTTIGLILAISSAFFMGLTFVVLRKIGTNDHPLVIINYFMIMAFLFGGFMSINHWKQPNFSEWFLLLSLGLFGYIGQLFLTKAFQVGETSLVAPLKYLEVIFTIIFGVIVLEENYNLWTLVGISLILVGLIYNIYLKKTD